MKLCIQHKLALWKLGYGPAEGVGRAVETTHRKRQCALCNGTWKANQSISKALFQTAGARPKSAILTYLTGAACQIEAALIYAKEDDIDTTEENLKLAGRTIEKVIHAVRSARKPEPEPNENDA